MDIPKGTRVWQVELKGGNIRHFFKYPSAKDIMHAFKPFFSPDTKWTEELLWEWVEEVAPCEWT